MKEAMCKNKYQNDDNLKAAVNWLTVRSKTYSVPQYDSGKIERYKFQVIIQSSNHGRLNTFLTPN